MTEGIIQEVFKPIIERYEDYFMALSGEDIVMELQKLQRELIEKIKQLEDNHATYDEYWDGIRVGINDTVNKLIGDNKYR